MKILQTLGKHGFGGSEGVFRYVRQHDGVWIDNSISTLVAAGSRRKFHFSHAEWARIVDAVRGTALPRITKANPPAGTSAHEVLEALHVATPFLGPCYALDPNNPGAGYAAVAVDFGTSIMSCVVAILEHEGTIDLDHVGGIALLGDDWAP